MPHEGNRYHDHDLGIFFKQDLEEMASEYQRVRARALEDPGTAGDEGEEGWASFLRGWVPDSYTVETKGRIIGANGAVSRQVDIVVLRPGYPSRLRKKKLYLAGGVAAAFECKTTLRASHLEEAAKTGAEVKDLAVGRLGTPYHELNSPIIYGVLAHSHSWKDPNSKALKNVDKQLSKGLKKTVSPLNMLDIVCIADLACWFSVKIAHVGPELFPSDEAWDENRRKYGYLEDGCVSAHFMRWHAETGNDSPPNPIAVAIAEISEKMGWEDPAVRPMADYYTMMNLVGGGRDICTRIWPLDIYSEEVGSILQLGLQPAVRERWNVWADFFA